MTTLEGRIREDLRTIVQLSGWPILAEALSRGTDTSEAAMIVAPAADPEVWRARRRDENYFDHLEDRLGDQHPGWVLGTWDMLVREHLDQPTTLRVSIDRAADYLGRQLTDLARDPEFPLGVMADEIHGCLAHLEQVLRDGLKDERTRIECIEPGCDGLLLRRDRPLTGMDDDAWECSHDGHTYDRSRFYRALHQQLASDGAERWVRVAEAVQVVARPEQTLRTWIRTGEVPSICSLSSRQILVWWPDVRTKHIESQTRRRRAS